MRTIQEQRKRAGFNIEDRIRVRWSADGDVARAIEAHADYIQREVLAVELAQTAAGGSLQVELERVS